MGLPNFQHHPDNFIFLRTSAGVYQDTVANFKLDAGAPSYALPSGYIGRFYEKNVRHNLCTENTDFPQSLVWQEGDDYIANYDTIVANKAAREA